MPPREQDLPRAQCNLAWCYEYGKGVPRIWERATVCTGKRPSRGCQRTFHDWPCLTMAAV